MTKVGFIGLGNLGAAIAGRLISEGVELVIWNRTRSKAEGFKAESVDSPVRLAAKVEIVFICLFDSKAVESILTGHEGLLAGDCGGKLVVDLTTNHFEAAERFHHLLSKQMAKYLEAPVLGSVIPASQGALTVLASGEKAAYDAAKPLLEKIASKIFYLGKPGLATKMKLINNLVLGSIMASLAEAVALGDSCGLDRRTVLDILESGAGNSAVLRGKREKLLTENFSPHFSTAAIFKDLLHLKDLATELKQQPIMAEATLELFKRASDAGFGGQDFSAVLRLLSEQTR